MITHSGQLGMACTDVLEPLLIHVFELHCSSFGPEKPCKQEAKLTHCLETLTKLELSPFPPDFYP